MKVSRMDGIALWAGLAEGVEFYFVEDNGEHFFLAGRTQHEQDNLKTFAVISFAQIHPLGSITPLSESQRTPMFWHMFESCVGATIEPASLNGGGFGT